MPKNDLKIRKSIKYTGKNKLKKLNSTIVVPSETEAGKREIDLRVEAGVVGFPYRARCCLRVNEEWNTQVRRQEVNMIEIVVHRPTKEHSTFQPEVPNRPLQLLYCLSRGRGRDCGEIIESVWVTRD